MVKFYAHAFVIFAIEGVAAAMYKISGMVRPGVIASPKMAETAREALRLFREARDQHARVWVNDEEGNDVSEGELQRLVEQERRGQ